MSKKLFAGMILAGGLLTSSAAFAADVVVSIGPPRAIVEHRGRAPGAGYVWVDGYHNWNGSSYYWVPGRWDRPPHRRARWERHHWVKRGHNWVLVEGRWR